MAVLHQMGHHSHNLLSEERLSGFAGAIVSPVNYSFAEVKDLVTDLQRPGFDFVFDPQLYFPTSERGFLQQWDYFPSDVDTADLDSPGWWSSVVEAVAQSVDRLGCAAAASPEIVPRGYGNDYYARGLEIGDKFNSRLGDVGSLLTTIVSLDELAQETRVYEIGSIVSRTRCGGVYLVLASELHPRLELRDVEGLKGALRLISLLDSAGLDVLVGYCSTDLLLWKAAGARSCATGKFFNLRRFTRSRFEEPPEGGGQLPYWTEESLCAFLRESDLIRVRRVGMESEASGRNPYSSEILEKIQSGSAWVGFGWRHFMWWFADVEQRISRGELDVAHALREAEQNWIELEDSNVLMEERRNDGGWLRPWRRALAEYEQD